MSMLIKCFDYDGIEWIVIRIAWTSTVVTRIDSLQVITSSENGNIYFVNSVFPRIKNLFQCFQKITIEMVWNYSRIIGISAMKLSGNILYDNYIIQKVTFLHFNLDNFLTVEPCVYIWTLSFWWYVNIFMIEHYNEYKKNSICVSRKKLQ